MNVKRLHLEALRKRDFEALMSQVALRAMKPGYFTCEIPIGIIGQRVAEQMRPGVTVTIGGMRLFILRTAVYMENNLVRIDFGSLDCPRCSLYDDFDKGPRMFSLRTRSR